MRIFILKPCLSEAFAFFRIGSNGMKAGWLTLFFVTAAIFAVVVLADEDNEIEKFSEASCDFTLNILKHVSAKYKSANIVFSPASISILLSILQQGAKENTLTQLEQVLSLTADESRNGFENMTLLKEEPNVQLEWGNRCYVRQGLKINEDFQTTVNKSFDIGFEDLDFKNLSPKQSADKINKWVAEVTHNKIKNLVDSSIVNPNTLMLLINAIFFKGKWLRPFKKSKTSVQKFETAPDDSFEALFMYQRGKFYSDRDSFIGAKWVMLPFQNERFAMIFVLPNRKHRLNPLIRKLKGSDLHQIFSYRGVSHVKIRLPKFKLSERVYLVDTLKEIGLTDIFTEVSDLSGMTPEKLQVSEIIHQANVEIDEAGSSSSAATVIELTRMRTPTLSFIADQPFLFFVVDTETKIPLFAGKVANPSL